MAKQFNIPAAIPTLKLDLNNFLGLDIKNSSAEITRSDLMYNFYKKEGLNRVRPVITEKANIDTGTLKFIGTYSGRNKFDQIDSDFCVEIRENGNNLDLKIYELNRDTIIETQTIAKISNYEDYDAFLSYSSVEFDNKLYIFTPAGPISLESEINKFPTAGWAVTSVITNLIDNAYIPTTSIARSPDGTTKTALEPINLLTRKRKNSFLGTAGTLTYVLEEQNLNSAYVVTAQILQSNGTYTTITEGSGLSVNNTTGVVTFSVAPGVTPIVGQDNVIITYEIALTNEIAYSDEFDFKELITQNTITLDSLPSDDKPINIWYEGAPFLEPYTVNYSTGVITLNTNYTGEFEISYKSEFTKTYNPSLSIFLNAKHVTVFGYENDKRVFVNKGTNVDTFSAANDITYFPDNNYTVLGDTTEVAGYGRVGNFLFTLKYGEDSCYVRYGTLINNEVVFPSLSQETRMYVLGKPIELPNGELLVPTTDGLQSIWFDGEKVKHEIRSYYIEPLIKSLDWSYFEYFTYENKLYISFLQKSSTYCEIDFYKQKEIMLVADLLQKTYNKEGSSATGNRFSTGTQFQYEWYVFTEVPYLKHYYTVDNNTIGDIKYFYNILTNTKYEWDEDLEKSTVDTIIISDVTKYRPIIAYRETPFVDFNDITFAKTIKYLFLNTRSKSGDYFEIGYILPDGTTELIEQQYGTLTNNFPKLIQIKSKISKFMNVKLYIKNKNIPDSSATKLVTIIESPATYDYNLNVLNISSTLATILVLGNEEVVYTSNESTGEFSINRTTGILTISPALFNIIINESFNNNIQLNYFTTTAPYIAVGNINDYKNTIFDRLVIEYQKSGKYRGD